MNQISRAILSFTLSLSFSASSFADDTPPPAKAPFDADQAKQYQQQWAKHIGKEAVYTNSIGMQLKLIPPGEFTMGRTEAQFDKVIELAKQRGQKPASAAVWEMLMMPAHRVRITKPFYMGTTEVTVAQYRQFCEESAYKTEAEQGLNAGVPYKGRRPICTWRKPMVWIKLKQKDDEPVLHLCWNDCVEFCKWLSEKEGVEYCLPTEAEWEYACRAGTTTAWSFGNFEDFDRLGHEYMFVSDGKQGKHDRPSRVAQKKPNAFGLYDMHGNVWEYVADWWHRYTYKNSPLNDPTGPPKQSEKGDMRRIIRTGSFDWGRWGAQSVYRMRIGQRSTQHPHQGFRVAMRIKDVEGVPPAAEPSEERRKQTIDPGPQEIDISIADKLPKNLTIDLPGEVKMDFVLIPPGSFLMGSSKGFGDEMPVHRVVISKPFYMAKYEVTTAQWAAAMGKDDRFKFWESMTGEHDDAIGPNKAMRDVSWDDCQKLVEALKKVAPGRAFALPTEAQWEYACRAGSTSEFYFGDDPSKMGEYAWYAGNMIWPGGGRTFADGTPAKGVHYHSVGKKKANAFGLYDMHGGNWEWCADYYNKDYYTKSPLKDPNGPVSGRFRSLRGGSWFRYDKYCRSAYRRFFYPASSGDGVTAYISDFGCRLVINLDDESTARSASSDGHLVAKAPFSPERAKELQRHWAKQNDTPVVETNSIGMNLTLIPPGEFMMGTTEEKLRAAAESSTESQWYQSVLSGGKIELPSHRVRITKPFYLGSTEVTVAQFRQFAEASGYKTEAERGLLYGQPYKGNRPISTWRTPHAWRKPKYVQKDDEPVLHVCWNDCVAFCKWLSEKEGRQYHLPTEAQWEYACRAGTGTMWYFADNNDDYEKVFDQYAWMSWEPKPPQPISVGRKKPNAFGLFDMHGNVWEYVNDWYHEFYFKESPLNDPPGPADMNEMRDGRTMIRGGSYDWADSGARSAIRMRIRKDSNQHPHMGFRVAMKVKDAEGIPPAIEERPMVRKDSDPAKVKPFDAVAAQKALAEHCDREMTIDLGGDTTMEFVAIPAGTFLMGSVDGLRDERPLHRVTLTQPFYIGKYEVTQGQWEALMGEHPRLAQARKNPRQAHNVGPNKPMYGVSWTDCQQFVAALKKKRPNLHFRLPTEAQWELACRAGSRTDYHFGDDPAKLAEFALVCADDAPPLRERDPLDTTVGRRKPNPLGVYDLHGSVWEWCVDRYRGDYYSTAPVKDPQGPNDGLLRVLRGGSWFRYGHYARSAYRHSAHPDASSSDFGFRVVINAGPPPRSHNAGKISNPSKKNDGLQNRPARNGVDYTKLARSLVRHPDNPVIKVGEKGAWNDQTMGCFTVLDGGDQFYFYSGGAQFGKKKNVGMATSKDGIHWTYYDKNPLFPGSMPYVIKVGDTFRLYHPGKDEAGRHGLLMKTSKDGFNWSKPKLVLADGVLDPCVIQVGDNRFHLYFCSGGKINQDGQQVWKFKNYMAISNDGITWNKQPKPVLPLGAKGSWDEGSHAGPCVLKLPDGFHMWHLGSGPMDGKIAWRIGHATSPDGLTWTKSGDQPVLDVGEPGSWDRGTFMSFDIIFRERDKKLLFWYAAAPIGHEDETKMKIQIGHGTSL